MGAMMTQLGVKPEIEAFDTGHLWYAKQLVKDGILESPALVQLCMGVPWGAPDDLNTFMAMVNNVPAVGITENLGAKIIGPQAVREKLGLTKQAAK